MPGMKTPAVVAGLRRNNKGFTLVETLISVLLISIVVISVFSVSLSSKVASKKTSRRAEALYYTRQAMEKLKAYVTVDPASVDLAADPLFAGIGPGGSWNIPDDKCEGCPGGQGQCWALDQTAGCVHDVTNLLPVKLTQANPGMKLTYLVADSPCDAGMCKKVQFNVTWAETDE